MSEQSSAGDRRHRFLRFADAGGVLRPGFDEIRERLERAWTKHTRAPLPPVLTLSENDGWRRVDAPAHSRAQALSADQIRAGEQQLTDDELEGIERLVGLAARFLSTETGNDYLAVVGPDGSTYIALNNEERVAQLDRLGYARVELLGTSIFGRHCNWQRVKEVMAGFEGKEIDPAAEELPGPGIAG